MLKNTFLCQEREEQHQHKCVCKNNNGAIKTKNPFCDYLKYVCTLLCLMKMIALKNQHKLCFSSRNNSRAELESLPKTDKL